MITSKSANPAVSFSNDARKYWERELHEDYLPITQDELELILTGMGYGFVKKDSSKLPFYVEAWANDFNLRSVDADRHKIVFLSWLKTLNTHIKWLVEK